MRARKNKLLLPMLLLLSALCARAQDTTQQLDRDRFLQIIQTYHPVAKSTALDVAGARGGVLRARGAFDPFASIGYDTKTLDGKEYYRYFTPGISIPTWYGVEVKAGATDARGLFLNPEETPGTISFVGAKVNVSNLFFDTRRAVVRQANAVLQQSQAERLLTLNDLYYQGIGAYWNWWLAWEQRRVWEEAEVVAASRLDFIRQEFVGGVRAAIDTTEALAQVQTIEAQRLSADLSLQNSGVFLNTYLWYENNTLVPWQMGWQPTRPALRPLPPLSFFMEQIPQHPKLQSARAKIAFLETDQFLKTQYLFPKIGVGGSLLSKGWDFFPRETSGSKSLSNNYKMEVDLSIPLLLREARGTLQMARAKTQQAQLAQDIAFIDIEAKVRSYYNEALNLASQQQVWEENLRANERLLQGETARFENGESTLFLINARQSKVLETRQKLLDLYAKRGKAEAALYWAAGILVM